MLRLTNINNNIETINHKQISKITKDKCYVNNTTIDCSIIKLDNNYICAVKESREEIYQLIEIEGAKNE